MNDETPNGADLSVTESTAAPVETQTEAPAAIDLDAELSKAYDEITQPRDESGKFASDNPQETPAEANTEGTPSNEAPEPAAQPTIEAPISMPSALKEEWAKVPPAAQEWIAKRETESHRQITHLGQQLKAYEPLGKLVESNRDVFQNSRRNVAPEAAISQLLEAQRQLDRDPVASIAHIAKVYGVDLSMFAGQDGQQGNQSPQVASLLSQNQHLEAKISQLEQLVMTREQREAQAMETRLLSTVESFLKENPMDDELQAEVTHHIQVLNYSNPELSEVDKLKTAYERAKWSNPKFREQIIAKDNAAKAAKQAETAQKKAAEAKRAASINVKSAPGNAKVTKTEDEILAEEYDRLMSA